MKGIFLDTETSGLNPRIHSLLEIAFLVIDLQSGKELCRFESLLLPSPQEWEKRDLKSLEINGLNWEKLSEQGRPAQEVADAIIFLFSSQGIQRKKAVFICQNPSFDRTFFGNLISPETQEKLLWPYHWLDLASMHWALSLEKAHQGKGPPPWEIGLSKDSIASYYHLPEEDRPHRAINGARHLLTCYKKLFLQF